MTETEHTKTADELLKERFKHINYLNGQLKAALDEKKEIEKLSGPSSYGAGYIYGKIQCLEDCLAELGVMLGREND